MTSWSLGLLHADLAILPQDTQSPAIPVVADHPTPSIADGEPILQSGDPDFGSQAAVTITPTVSFINGRHEITLEPHSQIEEEARGTEGSGDITDDFSQESTIRATTFSSLLSTKSPSVTASHETETSDTLKTAITRASSLYSTEKPTSGPAKTLDTVTTSLTGKTSATPETSPSFPTLEEESSVEQTTKMSSKDTMVPTSSSLFSTEKSTVLSIGEQASATTAQTEKSSVSAITNNTKQSPMITQAAEDGSGDQTSEMYTDISSSNYFLFIGEYKVTISDSIA
ncbi:uncharacterized protein [Pseudochaenichthys georgianus]|uniref:uncharacterized protein n=1 Tax=Pseudochaenichthys georgianus TaxID=52239 RepID=UPI0039C2D305